VYCFVQNRGSLTKCFCLSIRGMSHFWSHVHLGLNCNYHFSFAYECVYGCETWSLILREESRLRVFENRVFRRILGPKGDKVTGKWRKIHNEVLNNLYSSPNIVRVINLEE